eukprot:TRINITY_DN585_c0_g1_i5.p4 TRINITY_DN585_c0_g1~~TRINITY_DN585_c0_g1_i5.p4  ORF type:complete len:120 (-),score=18.10 TRINITY_DN585_c0_g1_i5:992-1351(-)
MSLTEKHKNSGEDRAKDEEEVTVQEARELAHQVDLVLAGPPCQGVSRANINRIIRDPLADERNSTMLRDLVEIVRRIRPALLLCENVCSILDKYVVQLLVHIFFYSSKNVCSGCNVPVF